MTEQGSKIFAIIFWVIIGVAVIAVAWQSINMNKKKK